MSAIAKEIAALQAEITHLARLNADWCDRDALYEMVNELEELLTEARKVVERFALSEPRAILPAMSSRRIAFNITVEVNKIKDQPKFSDWTDAHVFLAKLDAVNKP